MRLLSLLLLLLRRLCWRSCRMLGGLCCIWKDCKDWMARQVPTEGWEITWHGIRIKDITAYILTETGWTQSLSIIFNVVIVAMLAKVFILHGFLFLFLRLILYNLSLVVAFLWSIIVGFQIYCVSSHIRAGIKVFISISIYTRQYLW